MSKSFNNLFQMPFCRFGLLFLTASALLLFFGKTDIAIIASGFCWLIAFILCLIVIFANRFNLPGLSKHYSENFFGMKSISGRWYISETKPPQNLKKSKEVQRTFKKSLSADAKNIDLFPKGKYYTLTHQTVINALEKNPRVTIEKKVYKYKGFVPGKMRKGKREFFLVKFKVTDEK